MSKDIFYESDLMDLINQMEVNDPLVWLSRRAYDEFCELAGVDELPARFTVVDW